MSVAFQFFEVPGGIETAASPPTETRTWQAIGSSSQSYVNAYAIGATPSVISTNYGTLFRQDIRCQKTHYNQWMVHVPYGTRQATIGEYTWDFDTSGGTVHITNAKEEVGRFPSTTAPDQKGAIGVNGDEVTGTEIIIPALKINVNFKHPQGVITLPQAKFLASITGTTNSDSFLTFSPGEVLFLGARGSDGSQAEATVAYQFAMSSNITGQTIGGIASIAKKGWEYLWIRYEDGTETADSKEMPVRKPKFAYVDRVYEEVAMAAALGFGS